MTERRTGRRLRHVRSIDGLRAVAVLAVVAYHAGVTWLPGGFLGVDVFFVLSGYLIAAQLVAEWDRTEAIDLRGFWGRRARRLLPALAAVLFVTAIAALLTAPDALPRLRGDALAAVTYTSNWWQIVAGQSYFEALGRSPLLRHLWSLAVEEQFYLLAPLALGAVLPRVRSRAKLVAGALAVAVASTVWMAVLWSPGDDPSRVYFGTDTRLAGLLVGVAVAIATSGRTLRVRPERWHPLATGVGGVALALLLLRTSDASPWLYDQGGFLVVAAASALLLVGTAARGSVTGRILGCRPLQWIGTRSYAIYLWHWPVQQLTRPGLDVPWTGPGVQAAQLVLIGGLAEVSWRYVEQPVRGGQAAEWWRENTLAGRRLVASTALASVVLIVLALVVAPAPEAPWWEREAQVVAAGPSPVLDREPAAVPGDLASSFSNLLEATSTTVTPETAPPTSVAPSPPPPPRPAVAAAAARRPRAPRPAPATTASPAPTSSAPAPPAPPPPRPDIAVLAMGDSVMVAARNALIEVGGGRVAVDAVVGRQNDATLTALERYRDDGTLAGVQQLVVHIGTNGPFTQKQFDRLAAITVDVPDVVVVNVRVPKTWESASNRVIADNVPAVPRMRIADWHEASRQPGVIGKDGVHPTPSGAKVYARLALAARPEPDPPPETTTTTEPPPDTTTTTAPPEESTTTTTPPADQPSPVPIAP